MIDVNRQGEVWVFGEQHGGQLEDTPIELMSKARHLADTLGVKLAAALLGDGVKDLASKLIHYGADKVYVVEHPLLRAYQTNSYAKVMYDLIHKYEPQVVLYGATITGRDLAPRIASAAKAGLTADCTDLQIGDHEISKSGEVHKNLLFQIRPAFGGNIIATIINYDRWPQMATVREGVMPPAEPDVGRKGEIIEEKAEISQSPAEQVSGARKTSSLSGSWRTALGRHRREAELRLIWALSTTTIRLGKRGQRCGRACI
jgi:electron transfer flavoprotein alpha subunit